MVFYPKVLGAGRLPLKTQFHRPWNSHLAALVEFSNDSEISSLVHERIQAGVARMTCLGNKLLEKSSNLIEGCFGLMLLCV